MRPTTGEHRWHRTAPLETVRILVVEDNPGDERLVRLALSQDPDSKFDVTSARTLAGAATGNRQEALHRRTQPCAAPCAS
jgi:CheY-like chemotaxis protein